MTDIVVSLERLKALMDQGAMTEDEYRTAKARILGSLDHQNPPTQTADASTSSVSSEVPYEEAPVRPSFGVRMRNATIAGLVLVAIAFLIGTVIGPMFGNTPASAKEKCLGLGVSGKKIADMDHPFKVFLAGLEAEKINVVSWTNKGDGRFLLSTEKPNPLTQTVSKTTFLFREADGDRGSSCGPGSLLLEGAADDGRDLGADYVAAAWYIVMRGAVAMGVPAKDIKTVQEKPEQDTAEAGGQNLDQLADRLENMASQPEERVETTSDRTSNSFSDYKAEMVIGGDVAVPDLTGGSPPNSQYKTRINEAIHSDPQFAGKYNIVSVGCGNFCEWVKFVNLDNGRVIDLPHEFQPYPHDLDYKQGSRLLKMITRLDMNTDDCRFTELVIDNDAFRTIADRKGVCPSA